MKPLTLKQAENIFGIRQIILVKSARHDGLWYNRHIGECFTVSIERNAYCGFYGCYKATTCLTKYMDDIPNWRTIKDEIGGWFGSQDIKLLTREEFILRENRRNKLKGLI